MSVPYEQEKVKIMNHANYRKYNDRSHNSSKYHKLDGTPVRHKLKQESLKEIMEETQVEETKAIKFNHGELSQEGFVSGLVIVFENGLRLSSESLLWSTAEYAEGVLAKFNEVIAALESSGTFVYSTEVQEQVP